MREDLLKQLEALSNVNHEVSGARRVGENYFYYKVATGENDRKLYVRQKFTGAERLLVDPEKLSTDGKRYSIAAYSPSQNGHYVSYIVSAGGSEFGELRVVEVASGRDLGERIDRTRWSAGSWLPDGRSFVYWRQRKPDADAPMTEALQRIEYDAGHGFGTTKSQRNEEQADTYAFLFHQLMAPDAQAKQEANRAQ